MILNLTFCAEIAFAAVTHKRTFLCFLVVFFFFRLQIVKNSDLINNIQVFKHATFCFLEHKTWLSNSKRFPKSMKTYSYLYRTCLVAYITRLLY